MKKYKLKETDIPVMFVNNNSLFSKLIIYFHGNAEDAASSLDVMEVIGKRFSANVLIMEYPQYGVYKSKELSEAQIFSDTETVYDFCVDKMKYLPRNIIVLGRSIGTGPAIHLAAMRKVGLLALISPYLSIKKVGLSKTFAAHLIKNIFNSEKYIPKINCPVFILHGKKDELIPFSHGQTIHNLLKGKVQTTLVAPPFMTHNHFDIENDLIKPMIVFQNELGFLLEESTAYNASYPNTSVLNHYIYSEA